MAGEAGVSLRDQERRSFTLEAVLIQEVESFWRIWRSSLSQLNSTLFQCDVFTIHVGIVALQAYHGRGFACPFPVLFCFSTSFPSLCFSRLLMSCTCLFLPSLLTHFVSRSLSCLVQLVNFGSWLSWFLLIYLDLCFAPMVDLFAFMDCLSLSL